MAIEDWDIDGIAREVITEMKNDSADINDVDDYVHQIAYYSIYSRVPEDAKIISEKVKLKILEKYGA
ncbi:hypothetical protein [Desulfobacula sp.]|uniref:hypothetical protein n=1 Tax=Desulfobacula sp. TaxID=2593537 RepID=UPI0025C082D6|nr:hypothetical protein [Desulfobacula sp.]MBC2705610.1 hypothetical protein [Desulfobacula sp.]